MPGHNIFDTTFYKIEQLIDLTPENGQTHSNNSSANCRRIVWVCLTILWGWHLKDKRI